MVLPNDEKQPTPYRIVRFIDLLDDIETWGDENINAIKNNIPRGPQITFSTKFAEVVGDYLPVGTHYLHAAPNVGKSALVNMIGATCGCPALIVSTEIPTRELFLRQIARITNRPLRILGQLPGSELRMLGKATSVAIPQLCIIDATVSLVSPTDLQRDIRDLRNDAGHMLLVIDSIHSWARRSMDGSEYERMTAAALAFEKLAASEKIAIILVAERSRSTMLTGGMHAAKGTASIEYSGRSLWSLGVKNDGTLDSTGCIGVTLRVEKNKGPSGIDIDYRFFPELMLFEESST